MEAYKIKYLFVYFGFWGCYTGVTKRQKPQFTKEVFS